MIGKWESINGEERPNPWGGKYFLKRHFNNSKNEANTKLVFYTDGTYSDLNMTIEVVGPYHFIRPSAAVEGAVETDFEFTSVAVTPHTQAMVDMLNGIPSGYLKSWELNERQEVGTPGQGIMGIVIGEYKEYDLVKADNDLLYYGARPVDGSAPDNAEKRAKSLQVPLRKVN
jgi:adenomatous polyposis coli down-regulated (APCDD)-like protein